MSISKPKSKLRTKAVGLFGRVKDKFKDGYNNAKGKNQERRIQKEQEEKYNETLKCINNNLNVIGSDEYILGKMKKALNEDWVETLKKDPEGLSQMVYDFALIKGYHDFAKKDPKYTDEAFEGIFNDICDLLDDCPSKQAELYVDIKNNDIKEGQIEYLQNKIDEIKKGITNNNTSNVVGGGTTNKKRRKTSYGGFTVGTLSNNGGSLSTGGTSNETPTEKPVEVPNPTVEKEKARLEEINKKYNEEKMRLYNELDDYEKAFIDDSKAEGLEPGDPEFEQMLNERAISIDKIILYFDSLYDIDQKKAFEELDDYGKMFIEDANSEWIEPGDPEFDQMINERTVNKQSILDYYKTIASVKSKKSKIDQFYKKYDNNNMFTTIDDDISSGRSM